MTINTVLDSMKRKLSAIPNVKTCAVGIETKLNPTDYPMIRIVPTQFRKKDTSGHYRICDISIYFGLPIVESKSGMESIYTQLLDMEELILDQTRIGENYRSSFVKTVVSTSEVEHYKLCCLMLEVEFE